MKANAETLLGCLAKAARREPLWRITAPSWLARVLVAGGARLAEDPDFMDSRTSPGLTPPAPRGSTVPPDALGRIDLGAETDRAHSTPPADQAAFTTFFHQEYRNVVTAVMFAGASLPEAESVASNAMIEAFLAWPLLEDPAGWVRVAAIHDYLDATQRTIRPLEHDRPVPAWSAGCAEPPRSSQAPNRDPVLAAVASLSRAQREVTALSLIGHQPDRISGLLGRPLNHVRSSLRHAQQRLQQELAAKP